ncbi:MAG: DNA recombination protein RmuC [bacterium]|nr:DNA recombination protein RmuC [bacterium]
MTMLIMLLAFLAGAAVGIAILFRGRARAEAELARLRAEGGAAGEKIRWIEDARGSLSDAFKALASDALRSNAEQLARGARSEIEKVIDPVRANLDRLDKSVREIEGRREGAYADLGRHLKQLGEMHAALQTTTTTLAQALRSPTVRGRWGETQLRNIVEAAGMAPNVDFVEQASGEAGRPDMIIRLPSGGILPVDSKAPLESYLAATEARDDGVRRAKLDEHARALRGRVRELSGKAYWSQFERSADFVVMFVPSEASLNAAYERDPGLFEEAIGNKVLVASPVSLLGLLKVIAYGWQQQTIAESVSRIREEGRALYDRLATFVGYVADVGKSLQKSVTDYNRAVGSLETRLMPSARRFREMGIAADEMQPPKQVETQPRELVPPPENG